METDRRINVNQEDIGVMVSTVETQNEIFTSLEEAQRQKRHESFINNLKSGAGYVGTFGGLGYGIANILVELTSRDPSNNLTPAAAGFIVAFISSFVAGKYTDAHELNQEQLNAINNESINPDSRQS